MTQATLPQFKAEANKRFAEDEGALYDRLKLDEGEFVSRSDLIEAIDGGHITACIDRLRKKGVDIIHNSVYKNDPRLKRNRKLSKWALNLKRDVGLPEKVIV